MEFENKEIFVQAKKHFSRLGGAYFLGAVAIFVVQNIVYTILKVVAPQVLYHYDILMIVLNLSMYLLAFPVMLVLVRRLPSVEIQKTKISIGKWVVTLVMGYALVYILNITGVLLTSVLGVVIGNPVGNPFEEVAMEMSPLTSFFLVVLCAPIVEEYIFRKIIIDRSVRYGEKTAIVLSAFMFALFHGNLNQFVYAFGLGMFLGFIYVKTGRLVYTITLHAAVNFMGTMPAIWIMKMEVFTKLGDLTGDVEEMLELFANYSSQIILYMLYLIFILGLVITGIVFWGLHFKKIKCAPGTVEIPKGKRFRTVFLNVGMVLYSLFWMVQIVMQLFA